MGEEALRFNRNNKHSVQRQKGKIVSMRKVAESTLARENVVCWVPGCPSGVEPKKCLQRPEMLKAKMKTRQWLHLNNADSTTWEEN